MDTNPAFTLTLRGGRRGLDGGATSSSIQGRGGGGNNNNGPEPIRADLTTTDPSITTTASGTGSAVDFSGTMKRRKKKGKKGKSSRRAGGDASDGGELTAGDEGDAEDAADPDTSSCVADSDYPAGSSGGGAPASSSWTADVHSSHYSASANDGTGAGHGGSAGAFNLTQRGGLHRGRDRGGEAQQQQATPTAAGALQQQQTNRRRSGSGGPGASDGGLSGPLPPLAMGGRRGTTSHRYASATVDDSDGGYVSGSSPPPPVPSSVVAAARPVHNNSLTGPLHALPARDPSSHAGGYVSDSSSVSLPDIGGGRGGASRREKPTGALSTAASAANTATNSNNNNNGMAPLAHSGHALVGHSTKPPPAAVTSSTKQHLGLDTAGNGAGTGVTAAVLGDAFTAPVGGLTRPPDNRFDL